MKYSEVSSYAMPTDILNWQLIFQVHMFVDSREKVTARYQVRTGCATVVSNNLHNCIPEHLV